MEVSSWTRYASYIDACMDLLQKKWIICNNLETIQIETNRNTFHSIHSNPRIKFNRNLFPSFFTNIFFLYIFWFIYFFSSVTFFYYFLAHYYISHFCTNQMYKLFPPTIQLPPLTLLTIILIYIYYMRYIDMTFLVLF